MGVKKLFNSKWGEVYRGVASYKSTDVLPEQHIIILNRSVGRFVWSQLIMMFDNNDEMSLLTSRLCISPLSLAAYLHMRLSVSRLRKAGIVCNIAFEKGLVTCT